LKPSNERNAEVDQDTPPKKPIFDPTINMGNLLAALALSAAGMNAVNSLDRRLAVVETQQATTTVQLAEKVSEQRTAINEVRADVKDIQKTINGLAATSRHR
jgi:hypothetical protein